MPATLTNVTGIAQRCPSPTCRHWLADWELRNGQCRVCSTEVISSIAEYNAAHRHMTRRCPNCITNVLPATRQFFYAPSRRDPHTLENCLNCYRAITAATRARRQAQGITPRRRTNRYTASGTERGFGLEIEFLGSMRTVERALLDAGIDVHMEGYNHTTRAHWKIVPDGSVRNGGELVSPPLHGAEGRAEVERVGAALATASGIRVSRSTGLHVHHDVNDLDLRSFTRVFRLWFNAQSAINSIVARSRRGAGNGYAHPLSRHDVETIEGVRTLSRNTQFGVGRYRALNVQSYSRYGTVEVRQHQGTLNASKMLAWTELMQALITWPPPTPTSPS